MSDRKKKRRKHQVRAVNPDLSRQPNPQVTSSPPSWYDRTQAEVPADLRQLKKRLLR